MNIEEIIGQIPIVAYKGILVSLDILYNDRLRSSSAQTRNEAAAAFLDRFGSANFVKNMEALMARHNKSEQKEPTKVEWDATAERDK